MTRCCEDCTMREINCHAWCVDYINEKAEWDRLAKIERLKNITAVSQIKSDFDNAYVNMKRRLKNE